MRAMEDNHKTGAHLILEVGSYTETLNNKFLAYLTLPSELLYRDGELMKDGLRANVSFKLNICQQQSSTHVATKRTQVAKYTFKVLLQIYFHSWLLLHTKLLFLFCFTSTKEACLL